MPTSCAQFGREPSQAFSKYVAPGLLRTSEWVVLQNEIIRKYLTAGKFHAMAAAAGKVDPLFALTPKLDLVGPIGAALQFKVREVDLRVHADRKPIVHWPKVADSEIDRCESYPPDDV